MDRLAAWSRSWLNLVAVVGFLVVAIWFLGPYLVNRPSRGAVTVSVNPSLPSISAHYAPSVLAKWQGSEQTAFSGVLSGFQQQHSIAVNYQSSGDLLPQVLGSRVASGSTPDIAILPQPGLLRDLARQHRLVPLDGVVDPRAWSDAAPLWRQLATVDHRTYGVYFKVANKSMIWYRPSAFQRAGIAGPPGSYAELLEDTARLRQAGIAPFALCGASGWTLSDWFENVYLQTAGAERYDRLAQLDGVSWNDPTVASALDALNRAFGGGDNVLGGLQRAAATPYPDCVSEVFGPPEPRAAMVFEGDFVQGEIRSLYPSLQPGRDYAFFAFPGPGGGGPQPVVVGGDVAVMLRDTPQARELMSYLGTPQAADVWVRLGGFISPNRRVPLSSYPNELTRNAASAIVSRRSQLVFGMSDLAPAGFGSTVDGGEWADLQAWLVSPGDVAGAQARLERDAEAAYQVVRG